MLIRLVPPSPHPTILYALTFPVLFPLPDLISTSTLPAAWSSQLQILTSILQLQPPSSIHMLDRAVGLVARVHEVSMDLPQQEIVVTFVDGRVMSIAMNSDCVRMLLDVVIDVKGCSEPDSHRNSLEGSAYPASKASSVEDLPSPASPTKAQKLRKHKRQRSLLFSLISSLVPKSLSSPSSPPSTAPPPAPLPPVPVAAPMISPPTFPPQSSFPSAHVPPNLLRRRARATLVDVWRRHIISALSPQHLPAAGYVEWTLIAMASKVRAEIESIETAESHDFDLSHTKAGGNMHRRTQSQGRNALDFGDRNADCEAGQRRCRAPSPFPAVADPEDTDRVVYPHREQVDEWGIRYVRPPRSPDGADVFAVDFDGHNDSLLGEIFTVADDWDDNEQFTFENFDDQHLQPGDLELDCSDDDGNRLADMNFDISSSPLAPSDVNDDEQSDDSQTSLRTPEEGEELPLDMPGVVQKVQGPTQSAACSVPQPPSVSRVVSSRPRSRNVSSHFSSTPLTPASPSHSPTPSTPPPSGSRNSNSRDAQVDECIASRFAYLERICTALEVVRSRAREEGWRLVRATSIGATNGWMDAEAERSLEIKAKRRAWSAGIKITAPYVSTNHSLVTSLSGLNVWDGGSAPRSPMGPPCLISPSAGILQVRGPIVPTGLSLGTPVRSSPLAMYVWGSDDGKGSTPNKYGDLTSVHSMETIGGKRSSRMTLSYSVTELFPVCEDESEDSFDPVQVNAVGFPQAESLAVSVDDPEGGVIEGPADKEDDPFYFPPLKPRTRTTSMYVISPTSSTASAPVPPMFRPRTPPPSYQTTVGEDVSAAMRDEERKLDPSALLFQPLSTLCISSPSPPSPSLRPSLTSNPQFIPRPRTVSLPTPRPDFSKNKTRRTSLPQRDKHCEDLSQAYASPPPEGPLVVSATPAPHEQYPRYAHVHSPIPATRKSMNASILGRTGKEVMFEQAGSEFTLGIEVALGRAEEGRVVW